MPRYRVRGGSIEYQDARRALSRHMHLHHEQARGGGDLNERLEQHAELHVLSRRLMGVKIPHTHEIPGERETAIEMAHRLLREGEAQDG